MIQVSTEPGCRLVRAVFSGMLTLEEVARFSQEEQAAVRSMRLADGEFFLLVEAMDDVVQKQEVFEALRTLLVTSPLKAKRVATVRPTPLTQMQAKRGSQMREGHAVFGTVADARAWLFEGA